MRKILSIIIIIVLIALTILADYKLTSKAINECIKSGNDSKMCKRTLK